jgi:CHAT domain-containing protein/tetratricopeptide (TPR) repeat protein
MEVNAMLIRPKASARARGLPTMILLIVTYLTAMTSLRAVDAPEPAQSPGGGQPAEKAKRERQVAERDRYARHVAMLRRAGKRDEAIAAAEAKLAIEREMLGSIHEDVAGSLELLADMRAEQENFAAAKSALQEVLTIYSKLFGPEHWRVASARLALANLERLATLDHEQHQRLAKARRLNDRAIQLHRDGKSAEALPLAQEALEIRKQVLGDTHPDYAESLNCVGVLYRYMHDYAHAEPLLREAAVVSERVLGAMHPDYAITLNNLGSLYRHIGDYGKAELLYRQALAAIAKQAPGDVHPDSAPFLDNLASLYSEMGDYAKAEPLYRQALEARRRALGVEHPDYASTLSNLGLLYERMGDYAAAEPLLRQALEIHKRAPGVEHPDYASTLSNLGVLYERKGDYAAAEPLLRQALEIRKRVLGVEHPDYAIGLNNLAGLYRDKGDYAAAEPLFRQHLEIRRRVLGVEHPDYAHSLTNLAGLLHDKGADAQAEPLSRQALFLRERLLGEVFAIQSERQRIGYLRSLRASLMVYLDVALAGSGPGAADLYGHVLLWKGAVAARQAEDRRALDRPELRPLFDDLNRARSLWAQVAFSVPAPNRRDAWLRQLDELRNRKEDLEGRLARLTGDDPHRRQVSPSEVAQALPQGVVLVDVLEYRHFGPSKEKGGRPQAEDRFLAFVVRRDREPILMALGPSQAIRQAVQSWRDLLRGGDAPALDAAAARVAERVWKPLGPHLTGARAVLVAPDGALCRFPLAALPGAGAGSYLIEDLALGYVTSGRQVVELREGPAPPPARGMLAIGGIDYGAAVAAAPTAATYPGRGRRAPIDDRTRAGFAPLPGTEVEARAAFQAFRRDFAREPALLLTGGDVSEERMKRELAARWRFLHFAGHGFFAPPTVVSALRAGAEPADDAFHGLSRDEKRIFGLSPTLLSGLALVGVDRPTGGPAVAVGAEDGILTAEEVAGLDLRGTELVVLSACETGLGDVAGGEGVLGLQRAFQSAGAQTLVTTLWRVDDAATAVLMDELYANLWHKRLTKLEALRQAQLVVLTHPERIDQRQRQLAAELAQRGLKVERIRSLPKAQVIRGRTHPSLWAGLVLSGEFR